MRIVLSIIFVLSVVTITSSQVRVRGISDDNIGAEDRSNLIRLQPIIDKANPGDVILLEPGLYAGPIVIDKSGIILDGQGKCTIDGLGRSSVIIIKADSVEIRNLHIENSGGKHDNVDSGVSIQGDYNSVINCRIEECLFGIDMAKSNFNIIENNEISSFIKREQALKGDAIRLWYSKRNKVNYNYWHHVRDMVVWYSAENQFEFNRGENNRYGIHFMYSHNNRIHKNELSGNSVGVFLMYSEETIMTENIISNSNGTSGMCIGMKETSSNQILNNRLIYSAEGIHLDVSPFVETKINTIEGNEIAFCGIGMQFHSNMSGNLIKHNYFHNNLTQVGTRGNSANGNDWVNNYFDTYEGFDKDGDNIGDAPFRLYSYVEHIWDFNKNVRFFYGAPILAVLDFLERLAPFSEPKLILVDKKPMFFWDGKKYK